jgi:hypothetical protein
VESPRNLSLHGDFAMKLWMAPTLGFDPKLESWLGPERAKQLMALPHLRGAVARKKAAKSSQELKARASPLGLGDDYIVANLFQQEAGLPNPLLKVIDKVSKIPRNPGVAAAGRIASAKKLYGANNVDAIQTVVDDQRLLHEQ